MVNITRQLYCLKTVVMTSTIQTGNELFIFGVNMSRNCEMKYCIYCRHWIMTDKKKQSFDKCKIDVNKNTTPMSTCDKFEEITLASIFEDCCC